VGRGSDKIMEDVAFTLGQILSSFNVAVDASMSFQSVGEDDLPSTQRKKPLLEASLQAPVPADPRRLLRRGNAREAVHDALYGHMSCLRHVTLQLRLSLQTLLKMHERLALESRCLLKRSSAELKEFIEDVLLECQFK